MMARNGLLACILLVVSATARAVSNAPVGQGADAYLQEIDRNGASTVLRNLRSDKTAWDKAIENISSGVRGWVDVAVALRTASDAGSTSELHSAMFLALSKNPSYVLQVVELVDKPPYHSFLLSNVCEGRVDPPPTYQEAVAEFVRARAAIEKVQVAELQSKKKLCLTKLREGERHLRRMFGVTGQ